MKLNWKHNAGAFALGMAALSFGAGPALSQSSSTPEKPVKGQAGQAERGIKDNGVKGCGKCGITGKEQAPPTGETPPVEGATESVAGGPGSRPGNNPVTPGATQSVGGGPGSRPGNNPVTPGATARARGGPGSGPRHNWPLLVGGIAAAGGLVALAAGGGDEGRPTSP
jgi:hypothetical protein